MTIGWVKWPILTNYITCCIFLTNFYAFEILRHGRERPCSKLVEPKLRLIRVLYFWIHWNISRQLYPKINVFSLSYSLTTSKYISLKTTISPISHHPHCQARVPNIKWPLITKTPLNIDFLSKKQVGLTQGGGYMTPPPKKKIVGLKLYWIVVSLAW